MRRPRLTAETGGEALKRALFDVTGSDEPWVFEVGDVPVHAFYAADPLLHYLYSTFGLSRVNSTTPVAGTQTELTLRVPADEPLPPVWPAHVLERVARYFARTANPIEPGHHMDFGEPLTKDSTLSALIFVTDPLLGVVDTTTGFVRFTYGIAITPEDLRAALAWDARKFAGVLGDFHPLGLSEPQRAALTTDPRARRIIERVQDEQGSSLSGAMADYLDFSCNTEGSVRIDLTPTAAEQLLMAVRYRIGYGRSFSLVSRKKWIELIPGEEPASAKRDSMELPVSPQLAAEILAIFDAHPGTYRMTTAPLTIEVIDPQR